MLEVAAVAVGAVAQRVAGIGFGLVAAPAFVLAEGPERGVPLVITLNLVANVLALPGAWPDVDVRRTVRLKVAGAFHSLMMASATEALRAALADVQLRPPAVPFVSNVTGGLLRDPEAIRARLAEQVTRRVLWEESLAALQGAGATGYVEPAPGRVLTGLVKKVHADAPRINVESMEELLAYA